MLYSVSEGDTVQYEALKGLEIEEFYRVMDIWAAKKKKELESLQGRTARK